MAKWSDDDITRLLELRAAGIRSTEIAQELGRSVDSIAQKLRYVPLRGAGKPEPRVEVPPVVEQARLDRYDLRPRNLTAAICGDPLPGFSALERRA